MPILFEIETIYFSGIIIHSTGILYMILFSYNQCNLGSLDEFNIVLTSEDIGAANLYLSWLSRDVMGHKKFRHEVE